jgi:hypothetical protein
VLLVSLTLVLPSSATAAVKEKASTETQEQLQTLVSHYSTGDGAPVSAEELRKAWESFSIMLVDHYSKAKTREVLHHLASDKLSPVYPQLSRFARLLFIIRSQQFPSALQIVSNYEESKDKIKKQIEDNHVGLLAVNQY